MTLRAVAAEARRLGCAYGQGAPAVLVVNQVPANRWTLRLHASSIFVSLRWSLAPWMFVNFQRYVPVREHGGTL
jgi:hypothetical protein